MMPPAVVPGLFEPFQSLLSFLPQIAIAFAAAATALFRPQFYRWLWSKAKTHRGVSAAIVFLVLGSAAGAVAWSRAHAPPPLPPPTEEAKGSGWWSFRLNAQRTGSDGSAVGGKVKEIWQFREMVDRGPFLSSPAVWAGRVYTGCDNDALYCFNAEHGGDPIWVFPTKHSVFAPPLVANGKVYTGEGLHQDTDARFYCVDAVTGKLAWQFQTTSHVEFGGTIAAGRIYVGAGDDGIYCLDAATGAKIWQAKDRHVDQSPLVTRGLVIAGVGYGDPGVLAVREEDGQTAWFTRLPASVWGDPALGPRGVVVGTGNGNFEHKDPNPMAEIICLSPDGGGVVWRTALADAPMSPPAIDGDRIYLGDYSGDFSCFDANTGKRLWKAGCGHPILSGAAIAKDAVVYACNGGHVHAVSPADGSEIWRFDATKDSPGMDCRFFSSPSISSGRIFVGCHNYFFYCLGEK